MSVGVLLSQERGIRSNFTCAAKEDVHMHDEGKGRVQRVKRDRKGRTEECAANKRQALRWARRKQPKSDRYGI